MADSFDQIDNAEGSSLGSHLYECWLKGRHVDVTLKFNLADGSAFLVPAHKMVLERSRYFRAFFSGPLAASESAGEVAVRLDDPSISPDAVDAAPAGVPTSGDHVSLCSRSSSARASSSFGSASRPRRWC